MICCARSTMRVSTASMLKLLSSIAEVSSSTCTPSDAGIAPRFSTDVDAGVTDPSSVPGRCGSLSMPCVIGEQPDVRHVAVDLRVVHAVADHELVGDFETHIVGLDRHQPALRLVQAGRNLQ